MKLLKFFRMNQFPLIKIGAYMIQGHDEFKLRELFANPKILQLVHSLPRLGLHDVSAHTCKHTWASRGVMSGMPLRILQELGGWSSLAMVQRYAHLTPQHKVDAVHKITSPTDSLQESLQKSSRPFVTSRHTTKKAAQSS